MIELGDSELQCSRSHTTPGLCYRGGSGSPSLQERLGHPHRGKHYQVGFSTYICLVFPQTCHPFHFSFDVFEHKICSTVLYYENVKFRHIRTSEFLKNSQLGSWFVNSRWEESPHRTELLWQALALILLYNHGKSGSTNKRKGF